MLNRKLLSLIQVFCTVISSFTVCIRIIGCFFMEHDTYQTFIKLYNHACIHSSIIIKKLKGDVHTIIIRLK